MNGHECDTLKCFQNPAADGFFVCVCVFHTQFPRGHVTRSRTAPRLFLTSPVSMRLLLFCAGWSFSMGSAYQFHSWRVFVVVCALPCVSAVVALTFMPESPRFYLEVRDRRSILWCRRRRFHSLMAVIMTSIDIRGYKKLEGNGILMPLELVGLVFIFFTYIQFLS